MKRCFAVLLALLIALSAVGCSGGIETVTPKEFRTVLTKRGYSVSEQADLSQDTNCKRAYTAQKEESSFEYYFMKDESSAQEIYKNTVEDIKNTYEGVNDIYIAESHKPSSGNFEIKISNKFIALFRRKTAVLVVTATPDFEEEAKEILENFGY